MIENKKDREATKAARKAGEIHAPSWISYAGHVYLEGRDCGELRARVMHDAVNKCYICGEYCPSWDGDLEHFKSGRPVVRCWCYHRRLTTGEICTNVGWVHSMFSRSHACHRKKHNREVSWTKKS